MIQGYIPKTVNVFVCWIWENRDQLLALKKKTKQTTTTKSKTKNNKQTKKPTKTNIPVHVLLMEYSYNQRNILAPLGNGSLKKKIWHLGEMHKFCVWLKHIR